MLSSIPNWNSVDFYNPLPYQLNGECQSVPQHGVGTDWNGNNHSPGRQNVDVNDHWQSFHLSSSSARENDPSIWKEVVSFEDCKQASGCWRPTRCLRLTLDHRPHRRVLENAQKVGHQHWRHCVFGDKSRFTLFHIDGRVRVRRMQRKRLIKACIQFMSRANSIMVWGTTRHGGRSELVVLDGSLNRQCYSRLLRGSMLAW